MILPGKQNLEGVIGTTFDMAITLYPSNDATLKWQKPPLWNNEKNYKVNYAVVAENGKAYKCLVENINISPVGDVSGHWEKLTPINIEGYSSEIKIGNLELKVGEGIVLGGSEGTVKIKATPEQTSKFSEGNSHMSLWLTDKESNKYEYLTGSVKWKNP